MIVGPLQFDAPLWLLLIPALWAGAWWIARRSLSGLGGRTRWTALALRFIVIALLGAALAEPRWRSPSETVAVLTVVDVSRSMPPDTVDTVQAFLERGLTEKESQDEVGVITAAEESFVQALPSRATQRVDVQFTGDLEGTDLASGVRLAMAVKPEDAAARILLITDGNETSGSLLAAAESAASAGVPIDVLPVDYEFEREIIFQRLISPATARRGQPINLRFVIESTFETQARVTLLANEAPIDLDPESSGVSAIVPLERGVNVRTVPITLPDTGAQRFRAVVEPLREGEDAIAENNAALGVTFVSSEGRVLVYAEDAQVTESLVSALQASEFAVEQRDPTNGHDSLIELGGYDAVVLVDTPAYAFSRKQQDELRAYVHDLGGGLVMVGGPNSFGAGGWIGSPLADALPVKLDPPQKREMPRGALALIMHSCEMPRGNYWGQQTALAAVNALSRLDLVGVLEYDWGRGGSA
ncbi:MAG: vWA domain-containing protein, partial [Planctomycetota bacterium]|nr:vWA domain-containing protein [Planctomycetota bacterium]